jgi:hypothetical protein
MLPLFLPLDALQDLPDDLLGFPGFDVAIKMVPQNRPSMIRDEMPVDERGQVPLALLALVVLVAPGREGVPGQGQGVVQGSGDVRLLLIGLALQLRAP